MTTKMFRQGDVMIRRLNGRPAVGQRVRADSGRVILAYGEVTGHAHALSDADVMLFERPSALGKPTESQRFLEVRKFTSLKHEEHAPIELDTGFYEVIRQREYEEGQIRNVAD